MTLNLKYLQKIRIRYKVDNRNPKAKASSKYLLNKYLHLSDQKKFKEKVEMEKRNYFHKEAVRKKVMMMTIMMMMNLMIMMIGFIEMRKVKLCLLLKQIETEL